MKKHVLWLGLFGLISGIISGYSSNCFLLMITPGIIFGVITAIYLGFWTNLFGNEPFLKGLYWVAVSTFSYFSAYTTVTANMSFEESFIAFLPVYIFVAGCVGAFIMALYINANLLQLTLFKKILFVLKGGALGVVGYFGGAYLSNYITIPFYNPEEGLEMVILFIIWQLGMAMLLGYFMDKSSNNPSPEHLS